MKRLFLIRHAKSSWGKPDLSDFDRPLNKRGKCNGPEMAARLKKTGAIPDLIIASPAKRARETAAYMATGTGYDKNAIQYYESLYMGDIDSYINALEEAFKQADTVFLVGHNYTITELAEFLSGTGFSNVPTCGVVALEYGKTGGLRLVAGAGKLLFFDFPKNKSAVR